MSDDLSPDFEDINLSGRYEPDHIFDSMIRNAIEFFDHALDSFEASPKYSIISFCAGAELLIKARLYVVDWRLLFQEPGHAKREALEKGTFKSCTHEQAVKRIFAFSLPIPLSDLPPRTFDERIAELMRFRNRVVHYFDPEMSDKPEPILAREAARLCRCWILLNRFVSEWCANTFREYTGEFAALSSRIHRLSPFLQVKFDETAAERAEMVQAGTAFTACTSCGFDSSHEVEVADNTRQRRCLTCELREPLDLLFTCPHCGEDTAHWCEEFGFCDECEAELQKSDFLTYVESGECPCSWETEQGVVCSECGVSGDVLVLERGDASPLCLCLECFNWGHRIDSCDQCGTSVLGLREESIIFGCPSCEDAVRERFERE